MSLFRRRSREADGEQQPAADGADASELEDGDLEGFEDDDVDDEFVEEGADRSNGPWDVAERPDGEGYVDLGGIRLRGRDGMELRLELDENTGAV